MTVVVRTRKTERLPFTAIPPRETLSRFTGDWSWAQHHLEHGEIVCRASWTRRRLWLKQNKTLMMTTQSYADERQNSYGLTWADLKAKDWMIWNPR